MENLGVGWRGQCCYKGRKMTKLKDMNGLILYNDWEI